MNNDLFDEINKVVGEDDILWHLGDFCFAPKYDFYKVAKQYRNRIVAKQVFFVFGNHDPECIANLFTPYTNGVGAVNHKAIVMYNGIKFILDHTCPAIWFNHHKQAIALYGHSHSGAERWADKVMPNRRSMDIGVDNAFKILGAYRPFSLEEILNIMKNRKGHSVGDHHQPMAEE